MPVLEEPGGPGVDAAEALGATFLGDGRCRFVVWPPLADRVDVCLGGIGPDRSIPLEPGPRGYHAATVENVAAGTTYRFNPNGGYAFVLLGPGERPE